MEGGKKEGVRELGMEAEKQREQRCGIEKKKKKGKEEVWYLRAREWGLLKEGVFDEDLK